MEPPPPQAAHVSTTASIIPSPRLARRRRAVAPVVARLSEPRIAGRRPALQNASSSASMATSIRLIGLLPGGNTRHVFRGASSERAVVLTVTVRFDEPVPLSVTLA